MYFHYHEFIKKYNIEGWEHGRELPKYYKHIEFNCLGSGRVSEDGNLIYVLELDGDKNVLSFLIVEWGLRVDVVYMCWDEGKRLKDCI